MIKLSSLTIKKKIIGIILLPSTAILVIGFSFVISNEIIQSKQELIDKSLVEARFIGEYCVVYLSFSDRDGAKKILKKAESIPTIEAVGLYDEQNNLFTEFIKSDQIVFPPEPKEEVFAQFNEDHLDIFHPIVYDEQAYGTIYLKVSTNALFQKIYGFMGLTFVLIIVLVFLLYFVAAKLQKIISEPILELANATMKISEGADYSVRVQKKGNDEIGVLFDGFNNMMDQILLREKDLRQSKDKFRGMVMNLMEGFYSVTLEGKLLDYNTEFVRLLGLDPQKDYTGIDLPDFWQESDDRKDYVEKFNRDGFVKNYIINAKKSGGEKIVVQANSRLIRDAEKTPSRIEGVFMDITERKHAEEELKTYREQLEELVRKRTNELEKKTLELEQANIRLQEADRIKSTFLANMSHELRTPLNSIIGFTGMILMGATGAINDEQNKQLTIVKSSALHLLNLINDILDVSKIESGKTEVFPVEFDICEVIQEVIDTVTPLVNQKGLELREEIQENILILSDRTMVKQILMNLVNNAVKFTDQGSIRIESVVSKNEHIEVCVTDTGIGIKKDQIDKLFESFQQIDMSSTKTREGTGLGLHISKKLVSLLGGSIKVKSKYGKGCEFTVDLPLKYVEAN